MEVSINGGRTSNRSRGNSPACLTRVQLSELAANLSALRVEYDLGRYSAARLISRRYERRVIALRIDD